MSSPKTARQSNFYSGSLLERRKFDPLSDPGYAPFEQAEEIRDKAKDERAFSLARHAHTGNDGVPIEVTHLSGFIETVSAVPTIIPKSFFDSIKFYSNGGTRRLYVYVNDSSGTGAWRLVALT